MAKDRKHRYLMAAQAAVLAGIMAFAPGLDALAAGTDGAHQYVVSDSNEDPSLRHGADCVQDVRLEDGTVAQIGPEDDLWDEHHDGLCYKTGKDVAGDGSGAVADGNGEGDGGDEYAPGEEEDGSGEGAAVEHGSDCWQVGIVCDDDSPYHEHGPECTGAGWVDEHALMEHDDDICQHNKKPATQAGMFLNSLFTPNALALGVHGPVSASLEDDDTADEGTGATTFAASGAMDLPATGGEGTGAALALGACGSILGFAVLMAIRRRA